MPVRLCSGGDPDTIGMAIGRMTGAAAARPAPTKLEVLEWVLGPLGMLSLARDRFRGDDDLEEFGEPRRSFCFLDSLGEGKDMDALEGEIESSSGSLGDAIGVVDRDLGLVREG